MCNKNENKCKDIKNNNKTYKTSLLTSLINKKIEMRKCKSNASQLKQSQTDQKQLFQNALFKEFNHLAKYFRIFKILPIRFHIAN